MKSKIIAELEKKQMRTDVPAFNVGDTVEVGVKIVEGDKERVQNFIGTVTGRRGGGLAETFTVRRIVQDEGVERTFSLHSPKIAHVRVTRVGEVRRAKLHFLRDRTGKAVRVKGRRVAESAKDIAAAQAAAQAAEAPAAAAPAAGAPAEAKAEK